jgi:virginiamycin B lyase
VAVAASVALGIAAVMVLVNGHGTSSQAVALASGGAWFYSPTAQQAVRIDAATGRPTARVPLAVTGPTDVVQVGSSAVIVEPSEGKGVALSGTTEQPAPPSPLESSGDPHLQVVATASSVWALVQQATAVEQVDPTRLAPISPPVSIGATASGAAVASDGRLWVTSRDGTVESIRGGQVVSTTQVSGMTDAVLALVDDEPVVVDPTTRRAVALVGGGNPTPRCFLVDAAQEPRVTGASERPWLLTVATRTGSLVVTDLDRDTCTSTILGGTTDGYGPAVENGGLVFVPDRHLGQVVVVDPTQPAETQVRARIDLGLPDVDVRLFVHDQHVWFDDPAGDQAGVIDDQLHARHVSKSDAPPAAPNAPSGSGPGSPTVAPGQASQPGDAAGASSPLSPSGQSQPTTTLVGGPPAGDATTSSTAVTQISLSPTDHNTGSSSTTSTTSTAVIERRWSATANPSTDTPVEFTDSSVGDHTVIGWTFTGGDPPVWPPPNSPGSQADKPPPVAFSTPGRHSVTLTIKKPDGTSVSDTHDLDVTAGTPSVQRVDEFSLNVELGDVQPLHLVSAGGSLWVAEFNGASLLSVSPSGAVTPHSYASGPGSNTVAVGPDGNVWGIEGDGGRIYGVQPSTGALVHEFSFPFGILPEGHTIIGGPDGNLWFMASGQLARVTTAGVGVSQAPAPCGGRDCLTVGPDHNVWFVDGSGHRVGTVDSTGNVALAGPLPADANPQQIVSGPDGNLWFTDAAGRIGRVTTSHQVTEFPLPAGSGAPGSITVGSDGNVWFTESDGKVGRMTPAGQLLGTTDLSSGSASQPAGIASGPDNNIWVTENGTNKVARLTLG